MDPDANIFGTYVAYRDNDSWTSERGASKFIDRFVTNILDSETGSNGAVLNGFNVVPNTPSDMSIVVKSQGHLKIKYNDYCYLGWNDKDFILPLAGSDQAFSRYSYIVVYIDRDIIFDEGDHIIESPSVLKIKEIEGVAQSNPVPPSMSDIKAVVGVNNPYLVIALIEIPANATDIKTANIIDKRPPANLSPDLGFDPDNSFVAGVLQPDAAKTKTRIIITGPTAPTPAAIPGVQLIWLRKKV